MFYCLSYPFALYSYLNKMPNWLLVLSSAIILVPALIINLDKALVSVFPSLAFSHHFFPTYKKKGRGWQFYLRFIKVAFAGLGGIIASNQGIFFYRAFMRLLNMSRRNNYLAPTICLIVCFLEVAFIFLLDLFCKTKILPLPKPRFYLAF